ncbi:MAG: hypothetical protein PHQ40_03645 [Anaerolineaceae bacterium]|nr:hypothetical protein [Anaerolineaceae bacterium]
MKADNPSIQAYQRRCFREYKTSIDLPDDYHYLFGNPVNVLVPIETAVDGVMIVGAYPSAKFYTINGILDVPLLDNDSPFSNESYFDGSRVRSIPSGQELQLHYLDPMGIDRSACWITDLVKVMLFKPGHIDRYRRLGCLDVTETRSRYEEFSRKSIPWLTQEINLANPCVVFLLGIEVVSTLFGISGEVAKRNLDGRCRPLRLDGQTVNAICFPHPGILMKPSVQNPWPERFRQEILPRAIEELRELGIR